MKRALLFVYIPVEQAGVSQPGAGLRDSGM